MIDIPKIRATINTEEAKTVELPPIVATIETKENFVELPKVVADIRPEKPIVGNLGTMVAGKGKDGKDGADGYTPIKGIDYFDGNNGVDGKDGRTPVKGVDYFDGMDGKDGNDGKDGYTPVKGVDYFDGKDGRDGKDGKDGRDGINGKDGIDGKNGKDGRNGRTPIKGIDYRDGRDGKDGKDGLNGLNGKDGFSPKVLVEEIEGGHKITITDKDGEKSFDVMDGQGGNGDGGTGENGFSPTISVEEIENGHRITITDIDGTKTIDVLNGKNGIDGKDGYTPIKGVDYFDGLPGADGLPGPQGKAGIVISKTEPAPYENGDYPVWLNPDGDDVIEDYILETGVINGWTWEKWNSGKYMCFGVFEETQKHYTTISPFYGYQSNDIPYPIEFVEVPVFHFNCKIGNGFAFPAGDVHPSTTSAHCYALATRSNEQECVWEISAVGRWK